MFLAIKYHNSPLFLLINGYRIRPFFTQSIISTAAGWNISGHYNMREERSWAILIFQPPMPMLCCYLLMEEIVSEKICLLPVEFMFIVSAQQCILIRFTS